MYFKKGLPNPIYSMVTEEEGEVWEDGEDLEDVMKDMEAEEV